MQYQIQNVSADIISSVKFNPSESSIWNNYLLTASWDTNLSLYDTSRESNQLLTRIDCVAPLLDTCWDGTGQHAFVGGLEQTVRGIDLESGNTTVIGNHDGGISSLLYENSSRAVISGSWDKTIRVHDYRGGSRAAVFEQPHKVLAMDITGNLLVTALSSRAVFVYDIRNMGEPFQRRESSLKYTTRSIKCIPTGEGFASCSVEGRIAVDFFDPNPTVQAKKYAFKCHRAIENDTVDLVYPVNTLAFHPQYGTFVSGGGDSLVCFWDHKARKRLRQYPKFPSAIQSMDFHKSGSKLAIAYGGDSYLEASCGMAPIVTGIAIRSLATGEGKSKI
ncbi:WD40-repeat-containing domain protein [Dipodascopsis uninucleata]